KSDFIGRAAEVDERSSGGELRLVAFAVAAADTAEAADNAEAADADAIGDEPIWHDGRVVGWVTSGAFGHRVGRSLALGYVPKALAAASEGFEIEIIGERRA